MLCGCPLAEKRCRQIALTPRASTARTWQVRARRGKIKMVDAENFGGFRLDTSAERWRTGDSLERT